MFDDPLNLPVGSFLTVLVQLEDNEVKDLLEKELSGRNRPRYINAMNERIDKWKGQRAGLVEFKEEDEGQLSIENGKAFIIKDGKKEPYTSSVLPEPTQDSPERKKRAMELL